MLFTPCIKLTINEIKKNIKYIFFLTSRFDVDDWIEILDSVKKDGKTIGNTWF